MKASSVYSKSMNGDTIKDGERLVLTIDNVKLMKYNDGPDKLELRFGETDMTLTLNVTNNSFVVEKLGDETDNWPGAKIVLRRKKLDRPFKGTTHTLAITGAAYPPPPIPKQFQTPQQPPVTVSSPTGIVPPAMPDHIPDELPGAGTAMPEDEIPF